MKGFAFPPKASLSGGLKVATLKRHEQSTECHSRPDLQLWVLAGIQKPQLWLPPKTAPEVNRWQKLFCPQEGCPPLHSHLGCGHGGPWTRKSPPESRTWLLGSGGTYWPSRSIFVLPVQWAWITAWSNVFCSFLLWVFSGCFPVFTSLLFMLCWEMTCLEFRGHLTRSHAELMEKTTDHPKVILALASRHKWLGLELSTLERGGMAEPKDWTMIEIINCPSNPFFPSQKQNSWVCKTHSFWV